MIAVILIFLAWGSYLNSLAYRLLHLETFFKIRSFCPSCFRKIAWYDNIPVLSWLYLQAQCRHCKQPISWLYPCIELFTPISLLLLYSKVPVHTFPLYFLFFSALIVTIRTDCQSLLISRFVTTYLIPFGLVAAYYHQLSITPTTSILGIIFGYGLLWIAKYSHKMITGHEGIGQGDLELLAFIGAFTGPFGCWIALSIGSIVGTLVTAIYMYATKTKYMQIPFGAYLAFGAMAFILYQNFFIIYFFPLI